MRGLKSRGIPSWILHTTRSQRWQSLGQRILPRRLSGFDTISCPRKEIIYVDSLRWWFLFVRIFVHQGVRETSVLRCHTFTMRIGDIVDQLKVILVLR